MIKLACMLCIANLLQSTQETAMNTERGLPPGVGARSDVGCGANATKVDRLSITRSGTYENYLVDSQWAGGNRVKITADDVILRNCEIRNASGNGIAVFSSHVTIENCRIHHLLSQTFTEQDDAHGITGHPKDLVVRNCEIYYVSGDCVQFDPDRKAWGDVVIENSTFWTGPLPADAAGFKKGERPGENAVDTKTPPQGPRSTLTIRNSYFHGWNQPGQINLMAALNIKENVQVRIEHCLFRDNEVAFRLRGPTSRGGALVEIQNCAIFESVVGVRLEDKIRDTHIDKLGFGPGVTRKYHMVGRGPFPGYENSGDYDISSLQELRQRGF